MKKAVGGVVAAVVIVVAVVLLAMCSVKNSGRLCWCPVFT